MPLCEKSIKLTLISSANAMAPIVGMARRKLNLDASLAFNPSNNPAVIVMPDLEVPGINARH